MVDIADVREELGNPSEDIISDSTLSRLADENKTLYGTAARAAEIIARHFHLKADRSIGDYREYNYRRAEAWSKEAEKIREKESIASAGGMGIIDQSDKKPFFRRGMWGDD